VNSALALKGQRQLATAINYTTNKFAIGLMLPKENSFPVRNQFFFSKEKRNEAKYYRGVLVWHIIIASYGGTARDNDASAITFEGWRVPKCIVTSHYFVWAISLDQCQV
jgi:hypothetical protein